MKNDNPRTMRSGRELVAYAERHGCQSRSARGDHVRVWNEHGAADIPMHRELATGTRHNVLRAFALMGILSVAMLCTWLAWGAALVTVP